MRKFNESYLPQGIQLKTENISTINKHIYYYESRLQLFDLNLTSPYTYLLCNRDNESKEISITIKEITYEPLNNTVKLEKRIAHNLTCNRLSKNVVIQWLKDGKGYYDIVYENNTVSVFQLQGNSNEKGTYEYRWNNSRGEARKKLFTVSIDDDLYMETSSSTIITTVCVFLIALVAIGI
ncbi:uncharacterized protein LOC124208942 [Daphnia pulex]|uniref:uncharacterized protein LOC124208942 n=1 Tax=Daphnia pulex TaxID=6669 RepID=UPI001EE0B5F5|nr:uncharacterized protein LOC124208942 [Daphnia pulex]